MFMRIILPLTGLLLSAPASLGQPHALDLFPGATAAGQLRIQPQPPHPDIGGWDLEEVVPLTLVGSTYIETNPGFDANLDQDYPELDYFRLTAGQIWLEGVSLDAALRADRSGFVVSGAGDRLPLGGATMHTHPRYRVFTTDAGYDPLKTLWRGTFRLVDLSGTYSASAPFTIRFGTVACLRGDVSGDGLINVLDINDFVATLIDPAGATDVQRCAADVNHDGVADVLDINALVAFLAR